MADDPKPPIKWQGKVCYDVKGLTVDQIWPFFEDFCNLHKVHPNIDTCYQLQGEGGVIRYCAATLSSLPSTLDEEEEKLTKWVKEKLLMIDPIQRCLSYEILDNNIGFKEYVSTIAVKVINGDEAMGSLIEWSYVVDLVEGWTAEDLGSYIENCLEKMAKKIEETLLQTSEVK